MLAGSFIHGGLPTGGSASRRVCLQGGLHPGGSGNWGSGYGESAYMGVCIQGKSSQSPMLAATAAVGTHPTGMHSCFI